MPDEELQLTISGLHANGFGYGRIEGYGMVYVPFTFPGDELIVGGAQKIREGHWKATVKEVTTSQGNALSHCTLARTCGGCLWPGYPHAAQLLWKEKLFLRSIRGFPELTALPLKVHASAHMREIRSRVHLHGKFHNGKIDFGYYARGGQRLVSIADCPMAEPPLRDAIGALATLRSVTFPVAENFGFGIEIVHLPEENGAILLVLYSSPERRETLRQVLPAFENLNVHPIVTLAFEGNSQIFAWEKLSGMTLYTMPGCFQQTNRAQSKAIRQIVAGEIAARNPRTLFDLYSGSGNYSLPFAGRLDRLFACDENAIAIAVGDVNLERNGIRNAQFTLGDAGAIIQDTEKYGWPQTADCIVIDPARFGMSAAVLAALPGLNPQVVIYISNHTAAFTHDARELAKAGFAPTAIHLIDTLPNTPHVNIVTIWQPRA